MSFQGMAWAHTHGLKKLSKPAELMLLMTIGNTVGSDMRGCFKSTETLGKESLMSRSSAKRHLDTLADVGLILPGDPELVSHIRADNRPDVWDLAGGHEGGCAGGHSTDMECSQTGSSTTGQFDPPYPRRQKTRSATVQNDPSSRGVKLTRREGSGRPAATGQTGSSRGVKLTPKPNKELNLSLSSADAAATRIPATPAVSADVETTREDSAAPDNLVAAAVAAAWSLGLMAGGRNRMPKIEAAIGAQATELVEAGHDPEHLARVAEWMGRAKPTWRRLDDALTYPDAPQEPNAGKLPGQRSGQPVPDCPSCFGSGWAEDPQTRQVTGRCDCLAPAAA